MIKHTKKAIYLFIAGICIFLQQSCGPNPQDTSNQNKPLLLSDFEPETLQGNMSVDRAANSTVLNIGEIVYQHGVGISVPARVTYNIPEGYDRLEAWAGMDLTSSAGEATLKVLVDGDTAFHSGQLKYHPFRPGMNADRAIKVTVPVDGASQITLVAEGNGKQLFANFADLRLLPGEWPEYRPREMTTEVAATPPMGWNSWNAFGSDIDQDIIHEIADALVEKGFRDAGYQYLNLDAGWRGEGSWDDQGYPVYNKEKFPDGMKALGDYIHSKDLKFGIYSKPDNVGESNLDGLWTGVNERKFAETFAKWGVDYLKYDFSEKRGFFGMGRALKQVDRDIVYSVCGWGKEQEWQWASSFGGELWRTTYDVMAVWETGSDSNPVGVMDAVDQTEALGQFAGPGQWNDPDMLVVGLESGTAAQGRHQDEVTSLSDIEQRSQMSLYSLLSAPLIIGGDIRKMNEEAIKTLLNEEIIAIDQDPLAVPAWRALKLDDLEVWKKPLEGGDYALGLLNRGDAPVTITANWRQLNLKGEYKVRDLWEHKDMGVEGEEISRSVKPHQTIMIRLSPVE